MLKIRIMPTLLYRGSGLVKGVGFDSWRPVGAVMQAIRVYNLRQVDELVFLDIAATRDGREPDYELIDDIADDCFMPLTVGGGVGSVAHVERLLRVGADKVSVNSAAIEAPSLVTDIARRFGAQCVVASVDARRAGDGWEVVTRSGTAPTGRDAIDWCRELADRGAGEILLTSVERDGLMEGYEIDLYRRVCEVVDVPVIAAGGAGTAAHAIEVLRRAPVSAVAAAALFHFTEVTPLEIKAALAAEGFPVRRCVSQFRCRPRGACGSPSSSG